MNMLMTEWNWDEALAVRFEDGEEKGREEGREEGREQTAKNALKEGASPEFIQKITGLSIEDIEKLAKE
jgi:predicted transposase/invertase (TIGR01784 family)